MRGKLIALILASLVIGIGVGYGFGYAMSRQQVSNLQSQISTLTTNYGNLNATHNQLNTMHDNLLGDYQELERQLSERDGQIQSLQEQLTKLEWDIGELNKSYETLLQQYNTMNPPVNVSTTLSDFDVTISSSHGIYIHDESTSYSIQFSVTIHYSNGTHFEGEFGWRVRCPDGTTLNMGSVYEVQNGDGDFSFESYWLHGLGKYYFYIWKLTDRFGFNLTGIEETNEALQIEIIRG